MDKKDRDEPATCALSIPFDQLAQQPISVDSLTPRRFRFIDCRSFANREAFRVLEFADLPVDKYVPISYVWRGVAPHDGSKPDDFMRVKGVDADPISIEVLRIACVATLQLGCNLLWLDGVCIIQGNDYDKTWQIQNMYTIYKHCKECLVIPGGLSRLVEPTEETPWIQRGWTLQEAVAPNSCSCLFAWPWGEAAFQTTAHVRIIPVGSTDAAISSLKELLFLIKTARIIYPTGNEKYRDSRPSQFDVKIPSNGEASRQQVIALGGAIDMKGEEGMANAIWCSTMFRSTFRPVDMILSIMGILGVTLDPSKFSADDRHGATIALMQAVLEKGGRAEWLGIAPNLRPNPDMTTLPALSEIDDGKSLSMWWFIKDAPKATMDDDGYLSLRAPVASILDASVLESNERSWGAREVQGITVADKFGKPPYAVVIGRRAFQSNGVFPCLVDGVPNVMVLIDEHEPGRYHIVDYLSSDDEFITSPGWTKMTVRIK